MNLMPLNIGRELKMAKIFSSKELNVGLPIIILDDYDNPEMTEWNPGDYLFETDLITYIDTDYGFYNGGS